MEVWSAFRLQRYILGLPVVCSSPMGGWVPGREESSGMSRCTQPVAANSRGGAGVFDGLVQCFAVSLS